MRLIDIKEFCRRASLSRATVYKLISAGELPKPRRIGGAARWPDDDVDAALSGLGVKRQSEPLGTNQSRPFARQGLPDALPPAQLDRALALQSVADDLDVLRSIAKVLREDRPLQRLLKTLPKERDRARQAVVSAFRIVDGPYGSEATQTQWLAAAVGELATLYREESQVDSSSGLGIQA